VPGVSVHGFVPSMSAALAAASVAIAPMQSGSGIQNKVLEAMASGLPVVATTKGLGSIRAEAGRELLVADGPGEFAQAVVGVLRDPARASALGAAARSFVEREHSWEANVRRVEAVYESIRRR
jgi:glycosyltransferase involved in cell wall biosynthesis